MLRYDVLRRASGYWWGVLLKGTLIQWALLTMQSQALIAPNRSYKPTEQAHLSSEMEKFAMMEPEAATTATALMLRVSIRIMASRAGVSGRTCVERCSWFVEGWMRDFRARGG